MLTSHSGNYQLALRRTRFAWSRKLRTWAIKAGAGPSQLWICKSNWKRLMARSWSLGSRQQIQATPRKLLTRWVEMKEKDWLKKLLTKLTRRSRICKRTLKHWLIKSTSWRTSPLETSIVRPTVQPESTIRLKSNLSRRIAWKLSMRQRTSSDNRSKN